MAVTIGSVTEGNANAEEIKNNSPDSELYEKNKKYLQGSLVKFNDKIYLAKRNVPSDVDLDNPYYWEIFMDAADSKRVDELFEKTGNLDELETESKDNLVNAINEAVLYTAQSLTEEQQAQARANIGADLSTKMDANNPVGTGSFSMNRKAGTVVGVNSHAEGNDTTASRDYSHAEGCGTTASGEASHAEGFWTTAKGSNSHAEGDSTNQFSSVVTKTNPTTNDIITAWKTKKFSVAKGNYSHVEGKDNLALNSYSHAEGNNTTASGFNSHAEGNNTKATSTNDSTTITFSPEKGYYTHAEGYGTVAYGRCSHAEGNGTKASGNDSHSEGYGTVAYGTCSHAEGDGTIASGTSSHAEGYKTTASGQSSHAEGNSTNKFSSVVTKTNPTTDEIITAWKKQKFSVAKGDYSHVEGKDNLSLGDNSHAEGYQTTASGENSHAEGSSTMAIGYHSHAEGNYSKASGFSSHAEGSYTIASGNSSHVQGKYNIEDTSNTYADIIGNGTSDTARSNAATVDWNGNAWYAGDVYVGSTSGTNKDEGSKKLATEEYVNSSIAANSVLYTAQSLTEEQKAQARANIGAGTPYTLLQATAEAIGGVKADPATADDTQPVRIGNDGKLVTAAGKSDISLGLTSASVGQIIKVKVIDESGKPTAWEAADMQSGEASFPKFEKLLTHTITEEEIAANPVAFVWGTAQIPNLNDFNVFTMTIRNPDNTTNITFTKWVKLTINNVFMGNICSTSQGASYRYSISANRLYGFWVSDDIYNPKNDYPGVLTPPYSSKGFDSNLAASEAVTSIGFRSYGGDYGLTAGIIVEIWGAK